MTLGVLLPLAFAIGIAARKSPPNAVERPAGFAVPPGFEAVEWERTGLFAKSPVSVRLLREKDNSGRLAIECSADKNFIKPDLIVYWTPENSHFTDRLPDDARLLGPFDSIMTLPEDTTKSGGLLVLFSLADGEIVDISKPIRLQHSSTSQL